MDARPAQPRTAQAGTPSSFWPLTALAIGAFGIGTTEFSPMGMLREIAQGVSVDIPTAGLLISAYAIGVMVGAPIMTLLLARLRKRTALIALMSIFALGNLLAALAPGYWTLVAARIITSLNHGAFFGLGSIVAASLVPRERQASAIAAMFLGLTIATIGGVPAATWIGQAIGWRQTFAATALLGLLAMLVLYLALPQGEPGRMPDIKRELGAIAQRSVLTAMAATVLGAGAMFVLYTYVTSVLVEITHAGASFITLALALIGVGLTLGNTLGGRLADWSLDGAARLSLAALGLIMMVLPLALTSQWGAAIGLVVWGMAAFAIVPPLQMRVMQVASAAPGLASSINVGAFNLGNALGAAIGSATLSQGLGYAAIPIAGGLLALAGLVLTCLGNEKAPIPQTEPEVWSDCPDPT
ncbi:MFS transporter [Labrys sp. KNU-23]|uniref:MFS transporter n=1 Tax=Labrys sp. KNU-23 TaxID=2789216 RepID=UPI0011EC4C59|nr:MFS transporter [Labrys sp. KNU-23]QEN87974.1 MFS transporter [Labrys sp. KNU-23]